MNLAEQRRQLKGLLAEKKEEQEAIEVSIANALLIINAKANPYLDDFTELDADAILSAAQSLKTDVERLKAVSDKIKTLSKELL
jgi:hypothetical protein